MSRQPIQAKQQKQGSALFALLMAFCFVWFCTGTATAIAQCTNCSTTTVSGDVVLTFTSGSGSFTAPEGITSVQYLVIGGGGGGQNRNQGQGENRGQNGNRQNDNRGPRPEAKKFPAPVVPDTEATDTKARQAQDSRPY